MNLDNANETDIREDVAMPFLTALGYARDTNNAITRERTLSYDRFFLGHKTRKDPILRGVPDYELSVLGIASWILEIKRPSVDILKKDVVDQAMSYTLHPEIAGVYTAILNGKRLVVFAATQQSGEKPIVDETVETPEALANKMRALLSPESISRDFRRPLVDLGLPLASGFRSEAEILRGLLYYDDCVCTFSDGIPPVGVSESKSACERMTGMHSPILGGRLWRDENSRVRAQVNWSVPNELIQGFADEQKLNDWEYLCLDDQVSTDTKSPSAFTVVGNVTVEEGEEIYDIYACESEMAMAPINMAVTGSAFGALHGSAFKGTFCSTYQISYPASPGLSMKFDMAGRLKVDIDNR